MDTRADCCVLGSGIDINQCTLWYVSIITQIIIARGKSFQASMRSIAIVICLSLDEGQRNRRHNGETEDTYEDRTAHDSHVTDEFLRFLLLAFLCCSACFFF